MGGIHYPTAEHYSRFTGGSLPVVVLGDFSSGDAHPPDWDQVTSDNAAGARTAVGPLLELGHRRIAFVQGLAGGWRYAILGRMAGNLISY